MCEYKKRNGCGRICGKVKCKHMTALDDPIQVACRRLLSSDNVLTPQNVATIFFKKWKEFPDTLENEDKDTLLFLCNICDLRQIVCEMDIRMSLRVKKTELVERIVRGLRFWWRFVSNDNVMNVIERVQKIRRQKTVKGLQGPWIDAKDTDDPITLMRLSDYRKNEIWTYKDDMGHVFGFHAPTLYKTIERMGPYNPCNRMRIPDVDIQRLQKLMQYI